jgi:hypothetical protein
MNIPVIIVYDDNLLQNALALLMSSSPTTTMATKKGTIGLSVDVKVNQ